MKLSRVLGWSFVGLVGQVVLFFVSEALGDATKEAFFSIYWPWITLGEYVLPSGPGGHAMPVGAMLGILCGVIVYSIVVAVGICLWNRRR